jgi:hypothetical protein
LSGQARGPSPHQGPPGWTLRGPQRPAAVVGHQGAEPAMQTPWRLEGLKEQAAAPLGLLVWVQRRIAVGASDIPPGGRMQQCTAPRRVAHPCQQTALPEGEVCVAPHPPPPYQETSVVVCRSIEAIGIGHHRPKEGTQVEPWMPVLVRLPPPRAESPSVSPCAGRFGLAPQHCRPRGLATTPRRLRGPPRPSAWPWTPRARRLAEEGMGAQTLSPIAAEDHRGAARRRPALLAVAERAQSSGPSCWRARLCRTMPRAMIWRRCRRFSGGREAQSCNSGAS